MEDISGSLVLEVGNKGGEVVHWEEADDDSGIELSLVGKIISDRPFNKVGTRVSIYRS